MKDIKQAPWEAQSKKKPNQPPNQTKKKPMGIVNPN